MNNKTLNPERAVNEVHGITMASSFNFNDKVRINPFNIEGRVVSFYLKRENSLYVKVRYFTNNEIKSDFFFEEELELIEDKVKVKEEAQEINHPVLINKVEEVSNDNPYREGTLLHNTVELLSENKNKPYSSLEIAEALNKTALSIRTCLKKLRRDKKLKIVGYKEIDNRPLLIHYQLKSSPLEELKTKSLKDGYISITGFYEKNKHREEVPCPALLLKLVKENKLKMQPVLYDRGLIKGYKVEDLNRICLNQSNNSIEESEGHKDGRYKENKNRSDNRSLEVKILDYLKKHEGRGITSEELQKTLKAYLPSLQNALRLLKVDKKIKVVDVSLSPKSSSIYNVAYQLADSSLPTIKISKDSRRYITLKNFYKKYKSIKVPYEKASEMIKKHNIEETPLNIRGKIYRAYSIEELNDIIRKQKSTVTEDEDKNNSLIHKTLSSLFNRKREITRETISY